MDCDESEPRSVKLGLAVKWAFRTGASLDGASLVGASLVGARLDGARLDGASLVGARLVGARLDGARLDGASLVGARLVGARLDGASLVGASLDGASLDGASLDGASLDKRTLRSFKADMWMIMAGARAEIPGLIAALKEGRVDGRVYEGDCACLVGTIANIRHVSVDTLERDSTRPAEQWFMMIRKGDKPGDKSGGGFAASMALEWAEEFAALIPTSDEPVPA
ncbi:hypothetical protein AE618_18840 [Bosea vaviloviae]|uniref:Pentapeptide repeat protein n=1 Tax=Bosea vaviloviae TaxID=1526658 RepID=A0A0N1FG50_9HYPH|nr:hypothetical protein AE618_18840 [Bosea vaviloviae]